jgi:hypothetical protein
MTVTIPTPNLCCRATATTDELLGDTCKAEDPLDAADRFAVPTAVALVEAERSLRPDSVSRCNRFKSARMSLAC